MTMGKYGRWGLLLAVGLSAACGEDTAAERAALSQLGGGCVLDSDCTGSLVCVFQRCHRECNVTPDCKKFGFSTICFEVEAMDSKGNAKDKRVCQLQDTRPCSRDSECPSPLVCKDQCRAPCESAADCVPDQECIEGACIEPEEKVGSGLPPPLVPKACVHNSECEVGEICKDGACAEECYEKRDCSFGWDCVEEDSARVCRPPGTGTGGAGGTGGTGGTGGGGTGRTGGTAGLPTGAPCSDKTQCQSGVCLNNACQQARCDDFLMNGSESDVDCGGTCPKCPDAASCTAGSDCFSGVCDSTAKTCTTGSCADGAKNGLETGIDCGLLSGCGECAAGKGCGNNADCATGLVCSPGTATCSNAYNLSVSLAGSGSGTVTAQGLSCPGACSAAVAQGAALTLTATADAGSALAGFSGGCTSSTGSCTATITADTNVVVTFTGGSSGPDWLNEVADTASQTKLGPLHNGLSYAAVGRGSLSYTPCGSPVSNDGIHLVRYDASGKCAAGGAHKLSGALYAYGVDAASNGDMLVTVAANASKTLNWGTGPFQCSAANGENFVTARFKPGTPWTPVAVGPCRYGQRFGQAAGDGKIAVVGRATGGDLGGGAAANVEGFVALYSDTTLALTQQYVTSAPSQYGSVFYDAVFAGSDVVAVGWCAQQWNQSTQTWLGPTSAGTYPCIARLTPGTGTALTPKWINTIPAGAAPDQTGDFNTQAHAIAPVGNDFVIVGWHFIDLRGKPVKNLGESDGFIAMIDGASGAIKKQGSTDLIFPFGSTRRTYINAVTVAGGDIWIAGVGSDMNFGKDALGVDVKTPVANDFEDIFVARFDTNLVPKSAKAFSGNQAYNLEFVTGLAAAGGGGALLAGVSSGTLSFGGTPPDITAKAFVTYLKP